MNWFTLAVLLENDSYGPVLFLRIASIDRFFFLENFPKTTGHRNYPVRKINLKKMHKNATKFNEKKIVKSAHFYDFFSLTYINRFYCVQNFYPLTDLLHKKFYSHEHTLFHFNCNLQFLSKCFTMLP